MWFYKMLKLKIKKKKSIIKTNNLKKLSIKLVHKLILMIMIIFIVDNHHL